MLERDSDRARTAARAYMKRYLKIPACLKNLRSLGFDEADFAAGGSNRPVDAIVAWGDEAALRDRIEAHYEAGATHVCVLPLSVSGSLLPDLRALEALAPRQVLSGAPPSRPVRGGRAPFTPFDSAGLLRDRPPTAILGQWQSFSSGAAGLRALSGAGKLSRSTTIASSPIFTTIC